jgi:prophage regulatory protein
MHNNKPAAEEQLNDVSMSELRRMIRFPEIQSSTGYSRSRIYQLMDEGRFTRCIKLSPGGRVVGWPEDVIAEWQEKLCGEKGRAA